MSVYKTPKSPHFQYDFQIKGVRFHGSTGTKNRAAAERFEERERRKAAEGQQHRTELTLNAAFERYYQEVGQHLETASQTDYWLSNLLAGLGKTKTLADVTDSDIATYIARRRADVSNASVNRETQLLRRVYRRADKVWRADIGRMPNWTEHMLKEAEERKRELTADEERALFENLREDFHPLIQFALLSGARLGNCIRLTWSEINYDAGEIRFRQKGGRTHVLPITHSMRVLLANQRGNHPIYVFTYVCGRSIGKRHKGKRYPFSSTGWRRVWKKALKDAGITDFRFHDLRHTNGTRVLRATGNLKLAGRVLGHQSLASTMRYAHVLLSDMKEGLEAMESRNSPGRTVSEGTEVARKPTEAKGNS